MTWTEKLSIGILSLLILLVATAVGSSLFGFSYIVERLSHFQLQYWVIAMMLLSLLAIERKKPFFWIGLVFVAMLSVNLLTWYVPTNTQAKPFLKVLSSNIWTYNQNYPAVLDLVRKENPDIAMFYEVNQDSQKQLDTLNDILPYTVGKNTGAVIYTKLSLNGTKIWQGHPKYPNSTIIENLRHLDKNFTLIGTHPASPHSRDKFAERNQHLTRLAKYLAASDQALIMGGDFNVTMWSPYYHEFVEKSRLTNTRQGFGVIPTWGLAKIRTLPTWLQPWLSVPIDHIFIRSSNFELRTLKMKAGSDVGSDHLPIIAEIGVVEQ
jgi:endonuclease/exonuclease/phosphatase (EEP) superfamily protein YafD